LRLDAQNRSFLERLRLNYALLNNRYWVLPVDDVGHEDYSPVGRGLPSSPLCGRWTSFSVCDNDIRGKQVLYYFFCNNASTGF
jgi:hypothetical protein